MRKINYDKNKKYIAEEEGAIRKKRINWDRLVYMAILFAIVGSLMYYLFMNYYFISAPGQVVKESYAVLLPYDARINDILVQEDDSVHPGQKVLVFERDFRMNDQTLINSTRNVDEFILRERFSATRNIRTKEVQIQENEQAIKSLEAKIKELELLVILDVTNANKIETYEREVEKLFSENRILREEIKYWKGYLAELPKYKEDYQNSLIEQLQANSAEEVFKVPVEGKVSLINYKQYDLVYKRDIIMSVELQDDYIRAYIPQKEFGAIFRGDVVTVIFPDRTRSKGVIEKIYNSLEQLPPEYQDETKATTRSLLAIVRPLDDNAKEKWRENNKLGVEIRKRRFF